MGFYGDDEGDVPWWLMAIIVIFIIFCLYLVLGAPINQQ